MELMKTVPSKFQFPDYDTEGFVGREDDLEALDALIKTKRHDIEDVTLIRGMAGEGKSHLALAYCAKAKREGTFEAVFWLDGTSSKAFYLSWIKVYNILHGQNEQPPMQEPDLLRSAELAAAKLNQLKKPWLLVLDGYDHPDRLPWVSNCLPSNEKKFGAILITTRCMDSSFLPGFIRSPSMKIKVFDLKPLDQDVLLDLFFSGFSNSEEWNRGENEEDEAREILQMFGHHVWTITQVAPYLRSSRIHSFVHFQDEYPKNRMQVWSVLSLLRGDQSTNAIETDDSSTSESLSLQEVFDDSLSNLYAGIHPDETRKDKENGAFMLLAFLALFDDSCISEGLVNAAIECKARRSYSFPWQSVCMGNDKKLDHGKFQDLIDRLRCLSIVRPASPSDFALWRLQGPLSIHPIVREWLQVRLKDSERSKLIKLAFQTIDFILNQRQRKEGPFAYWNLPDVCLNFHLRDLWRNANPTSIEVRGGWITPNTFFTFLGIKNINVKVGDGIYPKMLKMLHKKHTSPESKESGRGLLRSDVYTVLGQCYMKRNNYDSAAHVYNVAIAEATRNVGPRSLDAVKFKTELGKLYSVKRDFVTSIPILRGVLYESPCPMCNDDLEWYLEVADIVGDMYYLQVRTDGTPETKDAAVAWSKGLLRYQFTLDHPDTARVLKLSQRLQNLHHSLDEEDEVKKFESIERVVDIALQNAGKEGISEVAWGLSELAPLREIMGERQTSERMEELVKLVPGRLTVGKERLRREMGLHVCGDVEAVNIEDDWGSDDFSSHHGDFVRYNIVDDWDSEDSLLDVDS